MVACLEPNMTLLAPFVKQNSKDSLTLKEAHQVLGGDQQSDIPFLVWLLENPDSPIALPGKIDLYRHDCIHILLDLDFSLENEAFIIGFTMGNDINTKSLHIALFKLISTTLYPKAYRFNQEQLKSFDLGVLFAKEVLSKNINQFNFNLYENQTLYDLRKVLGIDIDVFKMYQTAPAPITTLSQAIFI